MLRCMGLYMTLEDHHANYEETHDQEQSYSSQAYPLVAARPVQGFGRLIVNLHL